MRKERVNALTARRAARRKKRRIVSAVKGEKAPRISSEPLARSRFLINILAARVTQGKPSHSLPWARLQPPTPQNMLKIIKLVNNVKHSVQVDPRRCVISAVLSTLYLARLRPSSAPPSRYSHQTIPPLFVNSSHLILIHRRLVPVSLRWPHVLFTAAANFCRIT